MKVAKHKLLLSLLIILMLSIFVSAQSEAKSAVENFYKFFRTRNGQISTHELNLLKGWLTGELTALFRSEIKREAEFIRRYPDEKPFFGDGFPFEPFNECVIGERIILNRIETAETKTELSKAIVEVKFFIPKECESQVSEKLIDTYRIELLKRKSRWLINDWFYSDGKQLTNILKREKY